MTRPPTKFRDLDLRGRWGLLGERLGLPAPEVERVLTHGGLDARAAEAMIENAIGVIAVPLGVAQGFVIDGRARLVPMATEEPSVIAAASSAAKRVAAGGGFVTRIDPSLMAAQIELRGVVDADGLRARLLAEKDAWLARADAALGGLPARGGGARDLEVRALEPGRVAVHVLVDCRDAMGANLLNSLAEALAPDLAHLAGGRVGLRILTNYCDRRLAHASARVPFEALGAAHEAETIARDVEAASRFAEVDVYRAVTHNKGIMNGVDAVALATGNDFRAVEAAAHAHAAAGGRYAPLGTWRVDGDALVGTLTMPLSLGVVGGALRAHAGARLALALAEVETSAELAAIAASAGLASNLAALRALATEGIQRGHMALHRRALEGGGA